MTCWYCAKIRRHDPAYRMKESRYDLGKEWSRCPRHWRYVCSFCGKPNHFQATFFCPETEKFICSACSKDSRVVAASFWGWGYHWEYLCPSCDAWHPSLDYLEYEGRHPYLVKPGWEKNRHGLSKERSIPQAWPSQASSLSEDGAMTDQGIAVSWDAKAERWDEGYDEHGDRNRKYQSDPVLFDLLGPVDGQRILDAGCGNGYLCRLLAKRGAHVVGVELSKKFYELAVRYEQEEPLGVTYHNGTISKMPYIADGSLDVVVSNYVLMDCRDYKGAIAEFWRVLRAGGVALVVLSHPCFGTPSVHGWVKIPPDTHRREERVGWMVDRYFAQGHYQETWGGFDTPFISFHRTLSDYYHAFQEHGFVLVGLEEPSIGELGRRELPPHMVDHALRIPWSIVFKLRKPDRSQQQ